jgi:hypothetical protein
VCVCVSACVCVCVCVCVGVCVCVCVRIVCRWIGVAFVSRACAISLCGLELECVVQLDLDLVMWRGSVLFRYVVWYFGCRLVRRGLDFEFIFGSHEGPWAEWYEWQGGVMQIVGTRMAVWAFPITRLPEWVFE